MRSISAPLPLLAAAALLAAGLFLAAGCGKDESASAAPSGKPSVVATTLPVYTLARGVVGETTGVELSMLLPAGAGCPHDRELTPADMKKLSGARVILMNGAGLEEFLERALKGLKARPVDLSAGIKLIPLSAEEKSAADADAKEHGHVHAGEYNPHVFASPRNAAVMTANIARALAELDPANAEAYRKNAEAQQKALNDLADQLAAASAGFPNRRIVTNHDVFDYLARDMGLEVVAIVEREPGQAPSPGAFLKLIARVKEAKPAAIFFEPQYGAGPAEQLGKETKVPLFELDPFATGEPTPEALLAAWKKNLVTLKTALGARPAGG